MKAPHAVTSVTVLTSPVVSPAPLGGMSDGGLMVLGKVGKDKEEPLHLPPIHQPSRPPSSCAIRRTSSARFQYPAKPSYELPTRKTDRARSLVDIHEESVDNDNDVPSSTATEAEQNLLSENSKSLCENSKSLNENPQSHTMCTPAPARGRLLVSRDERRRDGSVSPCILPRRPHLLRRIDPHTALPARHPPYLKSLSQRNFGGGYHDDEDDDDDDDDLPAIFQGRFPSHGRLRNRSLSVSSFLPKLPPSTNNSLHSKSVSQPDIFKHSCQVASPSDLTESRKQRVQKLWRRAGQMLSLSKDDELSESTATQKPAISWVPAPGGGFLRPLYSRWPLRRDALAEPERMCLAQPVRERILKDVEVRRRSMKRRVSQFLTIKLGVNMEEDLIA